MSSKANGTFKLKIFSAFKIFYNDEATALSATNKTGNFDILPGHANFLTLLEPGNITVKTDERDIKFNIEGGLLHNTEGKVTVFLNI